MKVDFNNLRVQTCHAYDLLCKKLNDAIKRKSYDPTIVISTEDIQKEMDDLREMIAAIACCFEENNDDLKNVYEQEYPGEKGLLLFNEEN